ncbi:MAG: helix-turn-helix transcriptional regulator [Firmicutes bacterium]|nr:helix-turn-helix transcriptional regulator [Bacillota bacterium]
MRSSINIIVLKTLMDGDKYGYEIIKEVEEKTGGQLTIKQPSLYSSLTRLEKQKLISSYWRDSAIGGKRHYYSVTEEGRAFFEKNSFSWESSKGLVASILISSGAKKPEEFAEFDPATAREGAFSKSFSDKSKEYVKPDNKYPEYELNVKPTPAPTPLQTESSPQEFPSARGVDAGGGRGVDETNIDYKNILGDLCGNSPAETPARVNHYNPVTAAPRPQEEKKPSSNFSKQYEQALMQSAGVKAETKPEKPELSRTLPRPAAAPVSEADEPCMALELVKIKPYQKMFATDLKSRKFLLINRLRLFVAAAIFVYMLAATLILYFSLRTSVMLSPADNGLFIAAVIAAVVYMGIYLTIFILDPNKKRLGDIKFKKTLLVRSALAAGLIALIFCICLLAGMVNPADPAYLVKWLLPVLLCLGVFWAVLLEYAFSRINKLRA